MHGTYDTFCNLWSSSAFKAFFEKKKPCRRKVPKHKYDADVHVHKAKHMIRANVVLSVIYVVMRLTLNYRKFEMMLHQVRSRSL
jgi:hypothetical protein